MLSPARPLERQPISSPARRPPSLTSTSSPQVDHLFASLVDAAFDLVGEIGQRLSLLAYLHVPHDDQPLLFVRSPRLPLLSATDSFRLMHTITMLSNGRKPSAAFRHGDLSGHYNRTSGDHSDGLFVFGGIQPAETAARMTAVSRAFARVLHQFHLDEESETPAAAAPVISTELHGAQTEATVAMEVGGTSLHGKGTGHLAEEAVARAVFSGFGEGHTFDEFRRIDIGTRSAVLVAGHDAENALRLGLAISSGDILHTTANAAYRALSDRR